MAHRASRPALAAAAVILLAALAGCQTRVVSSDGRPLAPDPPPLRPAPRGAEADRLVVQVADRGVDTNGNGLPDMIPVEVYLFSDAHPEQTIFESGAMVFALHASGRAGVPGARSLAEWRFEAETMASSRIRNPLVGLSGYGFRLTLLDRGGDDYPLMQVSLAGRFEPADGREPLESDTYLIQIGRRQMVGP